MYQERFRELLFKTLMGMGIGFIISIPISIPLSGGNIGNIIGLIILFTFLLGLVASIIICSASGVNGFLSASALKVFSGLKIAFFSSLSGGSMGIVIGITKMIIGCFIMIPISGFMVLSYFFNFIYLGIRAIIEKKQEKSFENNGGI